MIKLVEKFVPRHVSTADFLQSSSEESHDVAVTSCQLNRYEEANVLSHTWDAVLNKPPHDR